jgi:hypothetical protein
MIIAFFLPNLVQIGRDYAPTLPSKNVESVVQIDFAPWLTKHLRYQPTVLWLLILAVVTIIGLMFIETTSEFLYFQF